MEWTPLWLSLKLATITTVVLWVVGIPIAYGLAYGRFRGKPIFEAIVALPLVLPPTVLGFYLLMALGRTSPLGRLVEDLFGVRLVFSFEGLVVASVIYSLPFMVHALQAGFESIPPSIIEASYTLGKSRWTTLRRVMLPNMRPAILTGSVLSFAHTIGEFGVVLMIGGNIPGETRVASIVIYDEVQALRYAEANFYAVVLFITSFFILLTLYAVHRRFRQ